MHKLQSELQATPSEEGTPAQTLAEKQGPLSKELDALLVDIERDALRRQKWNKYTLQGYALCMGGIALVACIEWLRAGHVGAYFNVINIFNLLNLTGWGVGAFVLNKKAVAKLAKLDDLRCVGPLVDVLTNEGTVNYSGGTRGIAQEALTRLLPGLKASDAHLLNEKQRAVLRTKISNAGYISFGFYEKPEFLIAILKAFEQIGDWKSAPLVDDLARRSPDKRVREAARACLPALQDLAARQTVALTLLRPAGASDPVAADNLLRPAANTEDEPQELLRAAFEEAS